MSVKLRRRGSVYWLDICHEGLRTRKSLGTSDRARAEQLRLEVENSVLGGRWGVVLLTPTPLGRAFERFAAEYQVLHHCRKTREHAGLTFARFAGFLSNHLGSEPLVERISVEHVEAFQRARASAVSARGTPLSPWSVNRELSELGTFFSWAERHGLCRRNPCRGVRPLRCPKKIRQPLNDEEMRTLVAALPEPMDDLVRLILNTGLRLGEALHLRPEDLDLHSGLLYVRSRPDYLIKDRQEREIPLTPPAIAAVRRRLLAVGDAPLLFRTSRGGLIDNRNALRDLHRACATAGMRRVNYYLLRHTFATVQSEVLTPSQLKELLGHGDIRTADRFYVHLQGRRCPLQAIAL